MSPGQSANRNSVSSLEYCYRMQRVAKTAQILPRGTRFPFGPALRHVRLVSSTRSKPRNHHLFGFGAVAAAACTVCSLHGLNTPRTLHASALRCEEDQSQRKKGDVKSTTNKRDDDDEGTLASIWTAKLAKLPSMSLPDLPKMPSMDVPDFAGTLKNWRESLDSLRTALQDLQSELSGAEGSVYKEIMDERDNAQINPEVQWDAAVRLGNDLGTAERAFVRARKEAMLKPFCKLLDLREDEVELEDIPVVAFAASGGGYRAMVSTLGSLSAAQSSGIWDLTSYTSAISGSCWAINTLYAIGGGNIRKTIEHVKSRIATPFLDPESLQIMTEKPTHKYIMSGPINKQANKNGEINIVDAYGTLVSCRLFVPDKVEAALQPLDLKISTQRKHLDDGSHPLPIYCTTHHEIPQEKKDEMKRKEKDKQAAGIGPVKDAAVIEEQLKEMQQVGRWLWFETTPYEFGCDELGAWIPTWSLGRLFENGRSVERVPETSLVVLSGVFASAFCATLFSYFNEIRPVLAVLPFFSTVNSFVESNRQSLDSIHPVPPAELPNFLKGMSVEQLRKASAEANLTVPEKITEVPTLGYIDAGAVCNVPYTPLFRRDCDLIIALDASADSQDIWFRRAQDYAEQRSLKSVWPRIKPEQLFPGPEGERETTVSEANDPSSKESASDLAATKVDQAKAQESSAGPTPPRGQTINPQTPPPGSAPQSARSAKLQQKREQQEQGSESTPSTKDGKQMPESGEDEPKLGKCNIWIGSSKDEHQGLSCRNDNPTADDVVGRDGIVLAYFPLTGGPELENVADVWSTWRFEYTAEETDKMVALSRANFKAGEEQLKTVIRGLWMRKKAQRLAAAAGKQ